MVSLTVGYVSGIIAAAVFVLQFLVPNALIVVLVGLLTNQHTAVTWSVVERNLLSSKWPTFLQSDSTAGAGVDWSIRAVSLLRPIGLGVITVAAVVTPLGLYEAVLPSTTQQSVAFTYVTDPSPMGYGTPPRSDLGFTRKCGDLYPVQCPGTTVEITYSGNDTDFEANITNDDYDVRIPKVLAELYQSGLAQQPQSVSSFFDIQSRQYSYATQSGVLQSQFIVDSFRYLSSVLLDNAIEPVEGLVVDTQSGGIAFRNHTVPTTAGMGAEWWEDLLWMEPETACVNLNVSIEFKVPYNSYDSSSLENITLVDNGGFANIVPKYPEVDLSDTQAHPNLQDRAYKAAWLVNAYTMLVMNLTRPNPDAFAYINSKVGDKYPVTSSQTSGISVNGIYITDDFASLLDPSGSTLNFTLDNTPQLNYSNPFNLTLENYTAITTLCQGTGGMDLANMTNIRVGCGLLFGAAQRRDGVDSLVFEPGTWWTQPVYACAMATKASIKSVHFRYNATESTGHTLKALRVMNVTEKVYTDNASMPLWGVETVDFYLNDILQLWGLISPELENSVNLSTIRAPQLYLPGYGGVLGTSLPGYENIPGTSGPTDVLEGIWGTSWSTSGITDYTGETNMAMFVRWQEFSRSAETVPTILNLIWTDLAANMLVGTKSWNSGNSLPPNLQKRDTTTGSTSSVLVPVTVYHNQIRYHWPFAIPALVSLLLFAIILASALLLMLLGRGGPARVRYYLFHLSAGRLLSSIQYPGECDRRAPTQEWIARVGRKPSDLHAHFGVGGLHSPFLGHMTAPDQKLNASTTELGPITLTDQKRLGTRPGYVRLDGQEPG